MEVSPSKGSAFSESELMDREIDDTDFDLSMALVGIDPIFIIA